jgi:hypothetical protein
MDHPVEKGALWIPGDLVPDLTAHSSREIVRIEVGSRIQRQDLAVARIHADDGAFAVFWKVLIDRELEIQVDRQHEIFSRLRLLEFFPLERADLAADGIDFEVRSTPFPPQHIIVLGFDP